LLDDHVNALVQKKDPRDPKYAHTTTQIPPQKAKLEHSAQRGATARQTHGQHMEEKEKGPIMVHNQQTSVESQTYPQEDRDVVSRFCFLVAATSLHTLSAMLCACIREFSHVVVCHGRCREFVAVAVDQCGIPGLFSSCAERIYETL